MNDYRFSAIGAVNQITMKKIVEFGFVVMDHFNNRTNNMGHGLEQIQIDYRSHNSSKSM